MSEYQLILRQITMMKEVAVYRQSLAPVESTESKTSSIEEHLVHRCYVEYDNKKITVVQLRDLLDRV